jgi:SNF2 family DNA or RNA helicase
LPGTGHFRTIATTKELQQLTKPTCKITIMSQGLVRYVHSHARDSWLWLFEWDRIVIDEGHFIVNKTRNLFAACMALYGRKRWILTGNFTVAPCQ